MGGPDGKIFGSRSWRTDRAQRGPCFMTESQIFSRPTRPNSVNKHFIIWPLWSLFMCSVLLVSSFGGRRAALLRAYFQGANDIAPFMWESQWSFENWSKFSSSGLILTKSLWKVHIFAKKKHNPNDSVMDERMLKLYETRTEKITKRLKTFFYWKIWPHDATFLRNWTLWSLFWTRRLGNKKDFGGGYCGDSGIRMRFQVGFHLRNWWVVNFPLFANDNFFRVCVSTSDCLLYMPWELVLISDGQSGMKDFPVSLSLIACK